MKFISPTYGLCKNVEEAVKIMKSKILNNPSADWTIAIGTDSQNKANNTTICSAILLIEKGNGGIYFYSKENVPRMQVIQKRMLKEAEISIGLGHEIIKIIEDDFMNNEEGILENNVNLEIHCDFGENGKSKDSIKAAIGWITAEFGGQVDAKVKPDSLAASCIADKYTK